VTPKQTLEQIEANPSTIWIRTKLLDRNAIAIQIADNGSGIPDKLLSRIFDPFYTTKPVGKGTGLGLSISYQIVTDKHKGQLHCFSQPEQGTQFTFRSFQ
jgi:signal transduction histidine kinase